MHFKLEKVNFAFKCSNLSNKNTNNIRIMAGLMPKVFEEANLSGELRLSGRKLKDFPKAAAKFNLSDTVIAGTHSHYSIFIARHLLEFKCMAYLST